MKQTKDVKFIIYQVLYIFIIVVITMKGADVDLSKVLKADDVIPKENAVPRDEADRLKKMLDSLLALGLTIELTPVDKVNGIKYEPIRGGFGSTNFTTNNPENTNTIVNTETPKDKPKEIQLEIVKPVQFRTNSVANNNDQPLEVWADGKQIAVANPNSSVSYTLADQKTVVYKCGGTEKTVDTKANETQSMTFIMAKTGNEDTKLRELQSTVSCRIKITDDFPDQVSVTGKLSRGKVNVESKGGGTYDFMLLVCSSKEDFDRAFGSKDSPYSVTLTVTATDKISGKFITQTRTFTFGEW